MHFKNNKIILFLRYLIAFGILAVLVIHVRNQYNIISILKDFNFQILLPVLLILTLHLCFLFIAWRLIIIKIGCIKPEENRIVHSFLGGRALGLITPAQSVHIELSPLQTPHSSSIALPPHTPKQSTPKMQYP